MKNLTFFKLAKSASLINLIVTLPSIAYNYFIIESVLDTPVNIIFSFLSLIVIFGFIGFGLGYNVRPLMEKVSFKKGGKK
jgi:hypothetical protein